MDHEKRRLIAIENLKKVQKRTGRPKKFGLRRTFRLDKSISIELDKYVEGHNTTADDVVNSLLLALLKKEKQLRKDRIYEIGNDPSYTKF